MMEAFDYAAARVTAANIIAKFGTAGTFTLPGSSGGHDDYGNDIPDEDDTIISGTVTPPLQYKAGDIDGDNILAGDCFVFFHSDTAPDVGMHHKGLRVVSVYALDSADESVNVFRKVQLRR